MRNTISPPSDNRAKMWRDPAFANVELLRAQYRSHAFPRHVHEEYAIGYIERGAQMYSHGRGERTLMPAGTICVINPGDFHEGRPANEDGWDYRMMYLPSNVLETFLGKGWGDFGCSLPYFPHSVIDDSQTLHALRDAHICSESRDASWLERGTRFTLALRQLSLRHGQSQRPRVLSSIAPGAITRAKEYVDANIASNPSLEQVAQAAGLSAFHLLRQFKITVGLPPHAYLVQRRVDCARRLLLKGRALRDVALSLGYSDQAHFCREF
jgi:AraC-like DNA-binding protein